VIAAEIIRVMQAAQRPLSTGEVFMAGSFDVSPSSVYVALNKMSAPGGRGIVDKTGSNKSFVYELRRGADAEEYLVRNSKARNHGARRRAA
tara:strand:- start:82 stop:354 length:273 start_codon:yes stop_codon:yes gene_type:complete